MIYILQEEWEKHPNWTKSHKILLVLYYCKPLKGQKAFNTSSAPHFLNDQFIYSLQCLNNVKLDNVNPSRSS